MPGQYTSQMLALKYGRDASQVRLALSANKVDIDANDMVDVDEVEAADKVIRKWLEDADKARMDAKMERVNAMAAKDAAKKE